MFGFINIFKPTGMTSRSCVDRIRPLVRPFKVGHAGTLDPLAEGVLLIAIGQASRIVEWVHELPKTYVARFELGKTSDSGDTDTEVTELPNLELPTPERLAELLPQFTGSVSQVPPIYSAVKVDGYRAYRMARLEIPIDLPARDVQVYSLTLGIVSERVFELHVGCESGTYIRSLGRDLARAAGSDAVMTQLIRTSIGPCKIEDSLELWALEHRSQINAGLLNPALLIQRPSVKLTNEEWARVRCGQSIAIDNARIAETKSGDYSSEPTSQESIEMPATQECMALSNEGLLLAVLRQRPEGTWNASKNFE